MAIDAETNRKFMELFPQYEARKKIGIDRVSWILAPEHLYDELWKRTPEPLRHLIIRIPSTGATASEFLAGREEVVRRSRYRGGTFEPRIGKEALWRYEITYFKCNEVVQRYRHQRLRHFIPLWDTVRERRILHGQQFERHRQRIFGRFGDRQ